MLGHGMEGDSALRTEVGAKKTCLSECFGSGRGSALLVKKRSVLAINTCFHVRLQTPEKSLRRWLVSCQKICRRGLKSC